MTPVPLVPAPLSAEFPGGAPFVLKPGVRVLVGRDPAAVAVGVIAAAQVGRRLGAAVAVVQTDDGGPGVVQLRLTARPADVGAAGLPAALAAEAYRVEVDARRIVVTALDGSGLLRGMATLEQLAVRDAPGGLLAITPAVVVDHPRFAWRGVCLDLARHWFDVDVVKSVALAMFTLKLNVLHLHLTDDQGWRVELPSRPALTQRSGTTAVGGDPGGFLTTAQYQDVVAYAAALGVVVVPEIDVPGHVNAALHAYGELAPSGTPPPPYTGVGVGFSRLDGQLPATADFIRDVFGDVAALTPGPYVHIGGDEALTMHATEYQQLVGLAAETVRRAGKTVVAWQEAARTPLPGGSVLQYWDDRASAEALERAAADGARVVLSPTTRAYYDMKYDDATPAGQEWAGFLTLRDAYDWDPTTLLAVPPEQVLGVEAAVWTETVRSSRELFLLLLPRLAGLADVGWAAPERRDWAEFRAALPRLTRRWEALGMAWYRPALGDPVA